MAVVASKHPFPLARQNPDWVVPVVLAPGLWVMFCYALFWGAGIVVPGAAELLLLTGLGALLLTGRALLHRPRLGASQFFWFCLALALIYLQLLLPRLWGWPA